MLHPFNYQKDCLDSIARVRKRGEKRALVIMASGLGKTVTAAFDTKRWLSTRPKSKILYLCHQNYILSQAHATFQLIVGGRDRLYGYYHGYEKSRQAQFLFASFQTMREKFRRFDRKEFDYIVVDESHHVPATTYMPVVRYFKPKSILGMTATPNRTDMQDIRTLFGNEVYSLDLSNALARGLLTRIDYRLLTDEIVELGKVENPYKMSLAELNRKIFVPKRDKEIVEIIKRKIASIKSPRVMIFCPSIRYTEELRKCIPDAVPVHSGLSRRIQEARISEFRDGSINTILTVDKFNEGIDIPEVNVVVFLRSTQSKTVFYQQLGRGLRKVTGKRKVLVLDFIANCERLLMVNEFAESVKDVSRKRPKVGKYAPKETLVVNGGSFKFTETTKNVLDVLEKVKTGYTPEVLIEQLQNEAGFLKRPPTLEDIETASREGRTASYPVFLRCFTKNGVKSWRFVLEAAGFMFKNRRRLYTQDELIGLLRAEAEALKRSPSTLDINQASKEGRIPSLKTYGRFKKERKIKGWKDVLRFAGLKPHVSIRHKRFSVQTLISQIRAEARLLGRNPTYKNIEIASKAGRTASVDTFLKHFEKNGKRKWSYILKAAKLI